MSRIVVIGGSSRKQAQSHRIAEIITSKLSERGAEADLLSFRDVTLPLWDEGKAAGEGVWGEVWPGISTRLSVADGYVFVTPEWHGMASPQVKNLLCCCDNHELAFKPGYLVTVSIGGGGAYPVSELRSSGYKNSFLQWLPEHLIVRGADGFRPGEENHTAPEWLERRLDHGLGLLLAMANAMTPVRESVDFSLLKTGM